MMSIFSIKFCYTSDGIMYRKSAVVRASSPDLAKEKICNSVVKFVGKPCDDFVFETICVSSFNFIFI